MSDVAQWKAAQEAEAKFHANQAHRARERLQRAFYSGLMETADCAPWSHVMDLGCGPESILLTTPTIRNESRRAAVDPLIFSDADENRYLEAGIHRVFSAAESLVISDPFNEVWIYNVLQHVIDPVVVIDVAARYSPLIRIFEWVDQPLSKVHIHSPSEKFIRQELTRRGLTPFRETSGRSRLVGKWDQAFYAGVWLQ